MEDDCRFTDRLRLEPIGSNHVQDLWRIHQEPGVTEWFGAWSRERAEARALEAEAAWRDRGVDKWIAYDRVSGDLVGRGGASIAEVEGRDQLEVGWALCDHQRGRGFATEIGRAGLSFCFENLGAEVVIAFTETTNLASRAVMDRLGMRYERDIVHDGLPMVLYALSRGASESSSG